MAGAELELPNATAEEGQEKDVQELANKEGVGEKSADKQEENEEDEESTYEAEENDDSDNTQVPEDEHTEVAEEAVIQDAEPKKEEQEDGGQKKTAGEEAADLEEETKAATVLQSNFRGYKERKKLEEEGKIPAKKQKAKSPAGDEELEKEPGSDEAEKEASTTAENADETKAAVVLQSNFRGHKERKRLEEEGKLPKKRQKEKDVPSEPPKEEETEESLPEPQENTSSENREGLDEEKAATVIQSNFRGHRDRKKMKAEREAQLKAKEESGTPTDAEQEEAVDLTDVVIERKDETDVENQRLEEEHAAVKIQSNFRGYKDRKNLKANKESAQKETRRLESFSRQVIASNRFY